MTNIFFVIGLCPATGSAPWGSVQEVQRRRQFASSDPRTNCTKASESAQWRLAGRERRRARGRDAADARERRIRRLQLLDQHRHACARSQRASLRRITSRLRSHRRIEPTGEAPDHLHRIAGKDLDLGRPHVTTVEAQAREERMLELQQRRAVELHALLGREWLDQHPARHLDPDRLVRAVVEEEVER